MIHEAVGERVLILILLFQETVQIGVMCGCVILWVCTLLFLKDKLARIGNVPEIYNGLIESVCQGFKRLLLLFL